MGNEMKNQIFALLTANRFCRAESAESARRIFARSLNADRPEGAREIRVSITQVRAIGFALPHNIGVLGYDEAVKKMPQRFTDDTVGQSYMNAENVKAAKADETVKNAESIIAAYFD
jgi:hypothetical protein